MIRGDELIEAVWQLAQEVDLLADEDREVLLPLVNRVAKIANAKGNVVELRPLDRAVHTSVEHRDGKTGD